VQGERGGVPKGAFSFSWEEHLAISGDPTVVEMAVELRFYGLKKPAREWAECSVNHPFLN